MQSKAIEQSVVKIQRYWRAARYGQSRKAATSACGIVSVRLKPVINCDVSCVTINDKAVRLRGSARYPCG